MGWPTDQEYNEAVQNPKTAFGDVDLQSGSVECYATGIPKARSGNFATVYKVVSNGEPFAVKCFRREDPEYSRRYPVFATHLTQHPLPYFVSFRYMSDGIRVGPNKYPILRMRWIEGESLISFIEKNLSHPQAISNLAGSWLRLLDDLHNANIAHGDLQHGNVLVVSGQLKLVDYDGMYVPALEGSRPLERGHLNYQHPERTDFDFGPYLDNFSAWLIYVSLLAVSVRPKLWQQLRSGDECLLFRKQDLVAPDQSEVFRLLRMIPDERIRSITERIEEYLWLPVSRIPAVTDYGPSVPTAGIAPPTPQLAGWISDHLPLSQPPPLAVDDVAREEIGDHGWIRDHVAADVQTGSFYNSVSMDRLITLCAYTLAALFSAWASRASGLAPLIFIWFGGIATATCMTFVALRIRYAYEPVRASVRKASDHFREANRKAIEATRQHEELKQQRQGRRKVYSADRSKMQGKQSAVQEAEAKELNGIDAHFRLTLQQINEKRRSLAAEEAAEKKILADRLAGLSNQISGLSGQQKQEMTQLDASLGSKVRSLDFDLQRTVTRRDSDLTLALKEYQDQIVNSHLHRNPILNASIPGIGIELKRRLAQAGYTTAADIGTRQVNVPGIGQKKWVALLVWRATLDSVIRSREAPKMLPTFRTAAIEQRYESQIKQLQQALSLEQSRFTAAAGVITKKYSEQKRLLEQQRTSEEISVRQRLAIVENNYEEKRNLLSSQEASSREQCAKAIDECKHRNRAAIADLISEAERAQAGFANDVEKISKDLADSAKLVRETSWRKDCASEEVKAYAPLTFRRYFLRVIGA